MLRFSIVMVLVSVGLVAGRSATLPSAQNQISSAESSEETGRSADSITSYLGDVRYVYKVYQECAEKDVTSCLKLKLVAAMDRAARAFSDLPLFNGIVFVKSSQAATAQSASAPMKTESEIEASLPRSLAEREDALNTLITDKITSFFDTHTIQIKLPTASELLQRSFNGEERGKKKKSSGILLLPLILGGTLIPLALGALALLAGKALIVSKLALVLAAIIGLKKLLSGHSGGHESGHEVVVAGGHSGGWARSYDKEHHAQNLAYSAYTPHAKSR